MRPPPARGARLGRRAGGALVAVAVALAAGVSAGPASAAGWAGVGARGSGPEAGCPAIMSHFDDPTGRYGEVDRRRTGDPAWNIPHSGIDFDVPEDTPVLAVAPGVVTPIMFHEPSPVGAINMVVHHGEDADGRHVFSFYTHLSRQLRRPGERVARGEEIARSGRTGTPHAHLHLSLWRTSAGPGPEFARAMRRAVTSGDRSILADPADFWAVPKRPGFDPARSYAERPIRLTYPLPCRPE